MNSSLIYIDAFALSDRILLVLMYLLLDACLIKSSLLEYVIPLKRIKTYYLTLINL